VHATDISLIVDPRRSTVLRTMATAADNGLLVSFDACFPSGKSAQAKRPVEQAMAIAHILKVNKRELMLWSGAQSDSSIDEMTEVLFARYEPLAVAVTLGHAGSRIKTRSGAVNCRPFSVAAVNGVGAGDGFIAGLLHALNRRLAGDIAVEPLSNLSLDDWEEAGTFANAVGALATRCLSASESLPRQSEVSALMG
jgi:fructokinase